MKGSKYLFRLIVSTLLGLLVTFTLPYPAFAGKAGAIFAWGGNEANECNVPSLAGGFTAVAAGNSHSLGLQADGSVAAWGDNTYGQCDVPSPDSNFIAIASGYYHCLGLKTDGSIVVWGDNTYGQYDVPPPDSNFIAIAASGWHCLGLKQDGSIVAWGSNSSGESTVPEPNSGFIAIAAGRDHSLGLKTDGSVIAWGAPAQCQVPEPNSSFIAIAAGYGHSLGIKEDGSIVAWPDPAQGQVPEPNTGFMAAAVGDGFSLGLKTDGSIVSWGSHPSGTPEPNSDFAAIAAGAFHCLALKTFDVDLTGDASVDFLDYAILANYWLDTNCVSSSNCNGADLDLNGNVDLYDLKILADNWLMSADTFSEQFKVFYLFKISIDPNTHLDYGASYPITYKFSIPPGSSSLNVYKKYVNAGYWTLVPEKSQDDFYNGIEAVRFDYPNNIAYVSVAFDQSNDNIYLKFTNSSGHEVEADYVTITHYYDNRRAVVTASADDWKTSTNDYFKAACDSFTSRQIWLTPCIITGQVSSAVWQDIQAKVDAGFIEPASHTRTHPSPPYDYDSEIGGSKQDLIDHLELPSLMKKGNTEYVYTFIEPGGQTNLDVQTTVGIYKYIVDRANSPNQVGWASYDAIKHIYRPRWTIRVGSDGGSSLSALNSKFDQCYNNKQIYHLMFHPWAVDWDPDATAQQHLDYIKGKKDVWYVGLGLMYEYHYLDVQNKITVEYLSW